MTGTYSGDSSVADATRSSCRRDRGLRPTAKFERRYRDETLFATGESMGYYRKFLAGLF